MTRQCTHAQHSYSPQPRSPNRIELMPTEDADDIATADVHLAVQAGCQCTLSGPADEETGITYPQGRVFIGPLLVRHLFLSMQTIIAPCFDFPVPVRGNLPLWSPCHPGPCSICATPASQQAMGNPNTRCAAHCLSFVLIVLVFARHHDASCSILVSIYSLLEGRVHMLARELNSCVTSGNSKLSLHYNSLS